jgi:carbon-monoxide dehydrogenase medium subunit
LAGIVRGGGGGGSRAGGGSGTGSASSSGSDGVKFSNFDYACPEDLAAALELLSDETREPTVLAGGQSLLPMMAFRMAQPALLVDVSRLEVLRSVSASAPGAPTRIGAAVTHAEIEDGAVAGGLGAFLARIASGIAYRAIRNKGTMGGSLAQADASADWPVVLAALDAQLHLASAAGTREVAAREFVLSPFETEIKPGELIVEVSVGFPDKPVGFAKSVRKIGEYAEALAVAVLHEDHAELWLGVVAGRPVTVTLDLAAAAAAGTRLLNQRAYRDVVSAVGEVVEELDDYVLHLTATTACRAMADALAPPGMAP